MTTTTRTHKYATQKPKDDDEMYAKNEMKRQHEEALTRVNANASREGRT